MTMIIVMIVIVIMIQCAFAKAKCDILCLLNNRPMPMKYGYDAPVWSLAEQFLFGYDFLVAPCMTENATEVDVYIPRLSGAWVHLVSSRSTDSSRNVDMYVC